VLALVTLQMLSTGFNMILVGTGNSNFFKNFAWGLLLLAVVSGSRMSFTRFTRTPRGANDAQPAQQDAEHSGAREGRP
jgi:hypothetical protein